jgi:enoyl-CoA hydratase
MDYQNLLVKKHDGFCQITINRPEKRNALDTRTWHELREAFRDIRRGQHTQTVILTSSGGKAFASGADIQVLKERTNLETLESETHEILNLIENFPGPVIAAIDGFALGGGCELAMACDIRIATRQSKLGQPEVGLGLIPGGGGTQRLQRLVGIAKAKELIFTGESISAEEACRIGLVNKVVESGEELMSAAMQMADKIGTRGPVAVSLAKLAINAGHNVDIHSGLLLEKLAQSVAFSTQDRIEGTCAFLEKRKPEFKGK